MQKFVFFLFLITSQVFAQTTYIDTFHDFFSKKIVDYSTAVDDFLSDSNISQEKNNNYRTTDAFFRNAKYIDETQETFISLGFQYAVDSITSQKFNVSLDAHLPLSKTNKKYNLFIKNLTKDNVHDFVNNATQNESDIPELGLNYFKKISDTINSKYSIGVHGIKLFTSARYSITKNYKTWKIEPTQQLKYFSTNVFQETTNIYFDKKLSDVSFFRTTLFRGTKTDVSGMDYGISLNKYWLYPDKTGLQLSQIFSSNTNINGAITTYTTFATYRKSVWRKWFFYSLTPSITFDEKYQYKADYNLAFLVQFYFGHIK